MNKLLYWMWFAATVVMFASVVGIPLMLVSSPFKAEEGNWWIDKGDKLLDKIK